MPPPDRAGKRDVAVGRRDESWAMPPKSVPVKVIVPVKVRPEALTKPALS